MASIDGHLTPSNRQSGVVSTAASGLTPRFGALAQTRRGAA